MGSSAVPGTTNPSPLGPTRTAQTAMPGTWAQPMQLAPGTVADPSSGTRSMNAAQASTHPFYTIQNQPTSLPMTLAPYQGALPYPGYAQSTAQQYPMNWYLNQHRPPQPAPITPPGV